MRFIIMMCVLLLVACQPQDEMPIPTQIRSMDDLATSQFMTANAPPEGFRDPVDFPLVDANLTSLTNWRYTMFLAFDGIYTGTPRQVSAEMRVDAWFNNLGPERRVVIEGRGELFNQEEGITIEGVRLGGDAFLVRDGVCLGDAEGDAELVADIQAGTLIGGATNAVPLGFNATINGERVWRYEFLPSDLNLPQIQFVEGGGVVDIRGELWVAPEHNVAIRYYVTMDVENAIILLSAAESPLPVSGQVLIRYDVYDIGINPNITRPFGC